MWVVQAAAVCGALARIVLSLWRAVIELTLESLRRSVCACLSEGRGFKAETSGVSPRFGWEGERLLLESVESLLRRRGQRSQRLLKRAFDVGLSAGALTALWPLLVGIGVAVRLDSNGPALFTQTRAGQNGVPFTIYKFRTMAKGSEKGDVVVTEGDARITRVGAVLRATSLDELPQLLNILKGEMSVVGPRPTLPYQVDQYTDFQRRRLEALPGVTGWAQIHGRNTLAWPKRIELDVWYVEHWTLLLDARVLLRTVPVVFGGEDLYGARENFSMFEQRETSPQ